MSTTYNKSTYYIIPKKTIICITKRYICEVSYFILFDVNSMEEFNEKLKEIKRN